MITLTVHDLRRIFLFLTLVAYHCFGFRRSLSSLLHWTFFVDSTSGGRYFSTSANDRRSVCSSSDDHPSRRKDNSIQPSCQGRVVNGRHADGFAHSPSGVPSLGDLVLAPVNVTYYVNIYHLDGDTRWLTAMQQDVHRLDFIDARYGEMDDTGLGAWKKP